MSLLLWAIIPYVSITVFIIGHIWRYKHDQFGWTTRSSQLLERRLLRWGMYLFHGGIFGAIGGHVIGLIIPKSWTHAVGISEEMYHFMATQMGAVTGLAAVAGLGILIYRRVRIIAVRKKTTASDIVMYVLLTSTVLLGTTMTMLNLMGNPYDYRETISPWVRSVLMLQPKVELMTSVPVLFKLHILVAFSLIAYWPFTRLVHVWSVPIGYLTRPYIVYRRKGER